MGVIRGEEEVLQLNGVCRDYSFQESLWTRLKKARVLDGTTIQCTEGGTVVRH
jgi:hypothetical protein